MPVIGDKEVGDDAEGALSFLLAQVLRGHFSAAGLHGDIFRDGDGQEDGWKLKRFPGCNGERGADGGEAGGGGRKGIGAGGEREEGEAAAGISDGGAGRSAGGRDERELGVGQQGRIRISDGAGERGAGLGV